MNSFHEPKFVNFSVSIPGTAERLPAFYVRDGFDVTITNPADSSGNFYLGATKTVAESGDRKILSAGQSMSIKIANTAALWVDADDANDVLEVVLGDAVAGSNPA
jgi:hypothetical protein